MHFKIKLIEILSKSNPDGKTIEIFLYVHFGGFVTRLAFTFILEQFFVCKLNEESRNYQIDRYIILIQLKREREAFDGMSYCKSPQIKNKIENNFNFTLFNF